MQLLDWNKLNTKDREKLSRSRKLTFITGPIRISKKRCKQLTLPRLRQSGIQSIDLAQDKSDLTDGRLLFGCLKDEAVPGLEGSPQFRPLRLEELERAVGRKSKAVVLYHFHKDIKYIIKELKPTKVIFVNGSWSGQIHYRSEYWKALEMGAKVELVSPFSSEREAKNYERIANSQQRIPKAGKMRSIDRIYSKTKRYSDRELLDIAQKVSRASWDWIGQIGAVLAKNGKVLAVAYNRVVPYQAYQMHFGSIRERLHTPAQEMLETQLTNHAEVEILEIARKQKINLKGAILYINIFPCPVCAKMLSRTDIKGIVYSQDHNLANDFGYKVLEMSGKRLKRAVL